jgi:hypothetical protein
MRCLLGFCFPIFAWAGIHGGAAIEPLPSGDPLNAFQSYFCQGLLDKNGKVSMDFENNAEQTSVGSWLQQAASQPGASDLTGEFRRLLIETNHAHQANEAKWKALEQAHQNFLAARTDLSDHMSQRHRWDEIFWAWERNTKDFPIARAERQRAVEKDPNLTAAAKVEILRRMKKVDAASDNFQQTARDLGINFKPNDPFEIHHAITGNGRVALQRNLRRSQQMGANAVVGDTARFTHDEDDRKAQDKYFASPRWDIPVRLQPTLEKEAIDPFLEIGDPGRKGGAFQFGTDTAKNTLLIREPGGKWKDLCGSAPMPKGAVAPAISQPANHFLLTREECLQIKQKLDAIHAKNDEEIRKNKARTVNAPARTGLSAIGDSPAMLGAYADYSIETSSENHESLRGRLQKHIEAPSLIDLGALPAKQRIALGVNEIDRTGLIEIVAERLQDTRENVARTEKQARGGRAKNYQANYYQQFGPRPEVISRQSEELADLESLHQAMLKNPLLMFPVHSAVHYEISEKYKLEVDYVVRQNPQSGHYEIIPRLKGYADERGVVLARHEMGPVATIDQSMINETELGRQHAHGAWTIHQIQLALSCNKILGLPFESE